MLRSKCERYHPMTGAPPLRSDAARNREGLLAAAVRAFAAGEQASMRAIAREAGVGVGTLYRHFPTREALVDAVYSDQVQRLVDGADELLQTLPPAAAMRGWMDLFADWVTTKHGMLATLVAMVEAGQFTYTHSREELVQAITAILQAGRAAGDIRDDVEADDVATALAGILTVTGDAAQRPQAGRLLDLLMDGLRPPER